MKRSLTGLVICLCVFLEARPLFSEETQVPADRKHMDVLRSLSINRSLTTRSEAEYQALLETERTDPSEDVAQRLTDLRYKISALKEDAERLQVDLPDPVGAEEFIREIVVRKEMLGQAEEAVDPAVEKKIDDSVRAVIQMHEKALSFVAAERFKDAAKAYEEIILISPDDDEAYLLLGHTCLVIGEFDKAGRAFGNAVHIDPANAVEIPRLYENILVENPTDDEAMVQLGYARLYVGDAVGAALAFEDALRINPGNPAAQRAAAGLRGKA